MSSAKGLLRFEHKVCELFSHRFRRAGKRGRVLETGRAQRQRFLRASAAIGMLFVALGISQCTQDAAGPSIRNELVQTFAVKSDTSYQEDMQGDVFEAFCEELIDVSPYSNARFSQEALTAGYETDCAVSDEFSRVLNTLEEKGWTCFCPEGQTYATFTKIEGRFIWAFASCNQISGKTVVTIQTQL